MRVLDVEQGTPEWLEARLGIPTASQFARIMTPKTRRASASQDGYLDELLAEWMIGASLDSAMTDYMLRGMELEADARRYYEFQRDLDVQRVGFVVRDDGSAGASPDGLVGDLGGLEIKCPTAKTQAAYLRKKRVEDTYACQIQGCMWICEREWWDVLAYHPEMPPALIRVRRDEEFIDSLAMFVVEFVERLEAAKTEIQQIPTPAVGPTEGGAHV